MAGPKVEWAGTSLVAVPIAQGSGRTYSGGRRWPTPNLCSPFLAGTLRGKGESTPRARPERSWECAAGHTCQEGDCGPDLGRRTVTKQKHLKRRVRERMQKTGESYTAARLHLLGNLPVAPGTAPPDWGGLKRIRFRPRPLSRRTLRPLGLRYLAPAFAIVISLVIGVGGFIVLTAPQPDGDGAPPSPMGRGA